MSTGFLQYNFYGLDEFGHVMFCRPKVESKVEDTLPEKSSFMGADSSAMKYVSFSANNSFLDLIKLCCSKSVICTIFTVFNLVL